MTEVQKQQLNTIQRTFSGSDEKQILDTIKEFKKIGSVAFLELLLQLLSSTPSETVRRAIIVLISDMQTQEFAPVLVEYIKGNSQAPYASELISAYWQSRLDFSHDLDVFADTFIDGSFQMAIESFTVIEEAMWQASKEELDACRNYLESRIADLSNNKKDLFNELIQVLESGKSENAADYPEFYNK